MRQVEARSMVEAYLGILWVHGQYGGCICCTYTALLDCFGVETWPRGSRRLIRWVFLIEASVWLLDVKRLN